ncbi:hypothetical protein ACVWYG_002566 [Pedobacter sp. UYEF25]
MIDLYNYLAFIAVMIILGVAMDSISRKKAAKRKVKVTGYGLKVTSLTAQTHNSQPATCNTKPHD